MSPILNRLINPFRSRKVRVALATVAAAIAGEWGLHLSDDVMNTILGVGAALILGIAHEDAGLKVGLPPPANPNPPVAP